MNGKYYGRLEVRYHKKEAANPENHDYEKKQGKQMIAGVEHTFAWGGGHGARAKYSADGVFIIIDVTAYYPSLQKQYHFGYRVMDHPENFEFIHDSNIAFKRKGDKKARQPFKIMDNAILFMWTCAKLRQLGFALKRVCTTTLPTTLSSCPPSGAAVPRKPKRAQSRCFSGCLVCPLMVFLARTLKTL